MAPTLPKPVLRSFEAVAQKIAALVQAEYKIGERLPSERTMAQQFGVSRPTIREAVLSLVMAGVLAVRHNSGIYVAGPPALRDVEAFEGFGPFENLAARRLVEPPLAAAAAKQPGAGLLEDLAGSLDAMRAAHAAGDEADVADHRFHMIIAEASGNGVLVAVCDMLWRGQIESRIWREIHVHMPMAAYRPLWLADHEQIYEAIAAGNRRRASTAMAQHLTHIRDALMKYARPGGAPTIS